MPKKVKRNNSGKNERDNTGYAHNPRYCMILPDAGKPDEDNIASSSES